MEMDLKLDQVIKAIDLVRGLSWGAIPFWFALTLPILYLAYSKLLPEKKGEANTADVATESPAPGAAEKRWQTFKQWVGFPRMDKTIVYASLGFFVIGTLTLFIDQHQKEKVRNNGLRLKQYFTGQNLLELERTSLYSGDFRLSNFSSKDLDRVLDLYPNEFMEVQENNTITLRDSMLRATILVHCERLLDSYLSNPAIAPIQNINSLFNQSGFFPREVVYQLLVDSPHKYTYVARNMQDSVLVKRVGSEAATIVK